MQCLVFRNLSLKKQRINFENSINMKGKNQVIESAKLSILSVVDSAIKLHFVSYITVSPGVKFVEWHNYDCGM